MLRILKVRESGSQYSWCFCFVLFLYVCVFNTGDKLQPFSHSKADLSPFPFVATHLTGC